MENIFNVFKLFCIYVYIYIYFNVSQYDNALFLFTLFLHLEFCFILFKYSGIVLLPRRNLHAFNLMHIQNIQELSNWLYTPANTH